ncbi:DUF948 domain-containing protein [Paenibacillus gansuensis]|uniref:DUF948 domain-containing protein n=1 Tax=Paenibacillus gansuensis TaxID=306542 RepID=A0ABW5PA00_9BACL
MITQLSVALIAVAFTFLVVYLIKTLKKVMESLDQTNRTLTEVQHTVNDLSVEAKQLIHTVNQITADVKGKISSVDPLFETAQDVGEVLHEVTATVKHAAASVLGNHSGQTTTATHFMPDGSYTQEKQNSTLNRLSHIANYVSLGSRILNRWKSSRVKSTF